MLPKDIQYPNIVKTLFQLWTRFFTVFLQNKIQQEAVYRVDNTQNNLMVLNGNENGNRGSG